MKSCNSLIYLSNNRKFITVLVMLVLLLSALNSSQAFLSSQGSSIVSNSQTTVQLCPESKRWPIFCSAILLTKLLNSSSIDKIRGEVIQAQEQFCDMIRILNKIDCTQPFTVSPKWRLGCQEAYRDWTCSLLAEQYLHPSLRSCDSTCHQVIRTCPYLSPDRIQYDSQGRLNSHPSQYGGHPTFYCPTTFTNEQSTENIYFNLNPVDGTEDTTCILFNPNNAQLNYTSFPLTSINLNNLNFIYCSDYSSLNPESEHDLLNSSKLAKVKSCCWTYNTALPKTYSHLSATLRKSVLKDENCVPLSEPESDSPYLYESNIHNEIKENYFKEILLQCEVWQEIGDADEHEHSRADSEFYQDSADHFYVDDDPFERYGDDNSGWDLDEDQDRHYHKKRAHHHSLDNTSPKFNSNDFSELESDEHDIGSSSPDSDNIDNESIHRSETLSRRRPFSETTDTEDLNLIEDYSNEELNEDEEYEHENSKSKTPATNSNKYITTTHRNLFISTSTNFMDLITTNPLFQTSVNHHQSDIRSINSVNKDNNVVSISTTQTNSQ